jgi:hypothetical protein
VLFLIVLGFILLIIVSTIYFTARTKDNFARMTDTATAPAMYSEGGASFGGYIASQNMNGTPEIMPMDAGLSLEEYDESAMTERTSTESGASLVDRKLTQNGYLSLVVDRVEDAIETLTGIADTLGGNVDSVQFINAERNSDKNAVIVIRVPADNFTEGLKRAKEIAAKVNEQSVSMNDVTDQFIDMQARMKNLKAEETQYQEILGKAEEIESVMRVSRALFAVREEIDRLQGQMNYLSRQVDMSIITITLSSEPDISTVVIWHPWTVVKEAVRGFLIGFYAFLQVIIYLILFFIPIFAIWLVAVGLVVWVFWKAVKKISKKYFNKKPLHKK